MTIERQYLLGQSLPNFSNGRCPSCQSLVVLNLNAPFHDNGIVACNGCGANTPRRTLILEALAIVDTLAWSFFGSNMYIWDQTKVPHGDFVSYNLQQLNVAKWLHQEAFPNASSGERYVANVYFSDDLAFLYLTDTKAPAQQEDEPVPEQEEEPAAEVEASWYRFGLQEPAAVPAWRQSLFGAATLVTTHPSAAVVLVAAGFESFFIETMRIAWREKQLDQTAFDRLNKRNLPLSSLIEWLPPVVNRQSLVAAPGDLYERWKVLVNERRNDVVHRANIHLTTDQAMKSMRAALDCMAFIDEAALVRPHAYYRTAAGSQATSADED